MSISTMAMMSFLISMFFVTLFTLEGYSEDGVEGIRDRKISISGAAAIAFVCFMVFVMNWNL